MICPLEWQDIIFHIKSGKHFSLAGNDTVYNYLGKFKGRCGGCYIPWLNDYVATNGDSIPVGVVFLGEYLAYYFHISYLLSSV